MPPKRVCSVIIICGIIVIGLIGVLRLWQQHVAWTPRAGFQFDLGPFQGKPCAGLPERAPSQRFQIPVGVLLVYDPVENETVPFVALEGKDGKVRWCVRAFSDNTSPVVSLRFSAYRSSPLVVRGTIAWAGDRERTLWFLQEDGQLREYWYGE